MEVLFDHGTVIPRRVDSKVTRIVFSGTGEARFVLQHTRDLDGVPDEVSWVDVSAWSNGRIDPKVFEGRTGVISVRGGTLVDRVNGEVEVLYRRHIADWLRVVPLEQDKALVMSRDPATGKTRIGMRQGDGECCNPCGSYRVTMEKARDVVS